ncbi:MAG: response regulator [Ardenticatenaceae bacterium]|nr:response regulator [Anaerolineales bacterium]MCB9007421.1 response regulator [Ardenticatenaceae bacterium]
MNPRVLIVDDEPMTRNLLRLMLERAGFEISEAEDGLKALMILAEELPDVLLLDVMMPNLDGLTVCKKLREQPETSLLPIILLSARTGSEAVKLGMAAGATRYLGKPISRDQLIHTIREVLQNIPSS